jgi:hypothetical protein
MKNCRQRFLKDYCENSREVVVGVLKMVCKMQTVQKVLYNDRVS